MIININYFIVLSQSPIEEESFDERTQPMIRQSARIDFQDDDPALVNILSKHKRLKQFEKLIPRNKDSDAEEDEITVAETQVPEVREDSVKRVVEKDEEEEEEEEEPLPAHLTPGDEFVFRVSILQLSGLSKDYADVFCQFNFRHRYHEAFSTESIKNSGKTSRTAGFYRIQTITVKVTRSFVDYLRTQPVIFELYGHYQLHPLHREATDVDPLFRCQSAGGMVSSHYQQSSNTTSSG